MLDNLLNSIGGDVVSQIAAKAGISEDQAQQAVPIAKNGLESGIKDAVKGGNLDSVLGMLNTGSGSLTNNSLFGGIKQNIESKVMTQLGVPQGVADIIAKTGLSSMVMGLAGKLGGAGNVQKSDLLSGLGLGDIGGLAGKAAGLMGGKKLF